MADTNATNTETSFNWTQWNNDLVFKLIDHYRERPVLWDLDLPEHKDKRKKKVAWVQIAQAMGMDKQTVERKIKILYTQFRRELLIRSDTEESKWFAFKNMYFLKKRVFKALSDPESVAIARDDDVYVYDAVPGPNSDASSSSGHNQTTKRRRESETELEETKTGEIYRLVTELYRDRFSKDEFSVFGEHVALKLRKMDNLYARCTAQYHINNILYKAETGEYDYMGDSKPNIGTL
ncbi:uncharacterized protein LOC128677097 isoform X2 [Plodia interpunctella]|uniref:uncharacterized protein LOC128677097 isoform X2 n=1 Tax=Plodia interpunctella TaxID=58824 RepID=UPI002367881F|nr:uncharacterized protein LOC128677097 isoform X2 [Plodia interpunctella]